MASPLECWSSRATTTTAATTDDDTVEQVLMRSHHRSEATTTPSFPSSTKDSSMVQKKLHKFARNVSEAINSFKNSLNLDSTRDPTSCKIEASRKITWGTVVKNLTQLYPGSQLPEKLMCNIRKHYDSLPLSYGQAEFDMKDVFLHIKLIEQASETDQPAILFQEETDNDVEVEGSLLKLTFACNSPISWPAMSSALDSSSISCKKMQIFEKKNFTLGVAILVYQSGQDKLLRVRVENAIKFAMKKPRSSAVKLPFGLCGCQEENFRGRELGDSEEDGGDACYGKEFENSCQNIQLQMPLPSSSFIVSVDEWQTIHSGVDEIEKWLLSSDSVEFTDKVEPNSYKGVYMGKRVGIEKLKGCDKGNSYEFELRKDLLELMTCGHRNILQFCGVCVDDNHGLCVVTKYMEGGSVHDLMSKNKKLQTKDIVRIAVDVAEGMKFMNDHGVAYRDLNTQRILLDKHGNACLGDMGIVTACRSVGEAIEYETDGYRWLAPEIIAGDPESVTETWMSNVYSYGMVIWEMVTGEVAYSAFSPVQAAVGIAACGLRPEIPKDCPQTLKHLMTKCWNNTPSKRPQFSDILAMLLRPNNNNRLVHCMLPRKRASGEGGVVVEGDTDTTTNTVASASASALSLSKKNRTGCFAECSGSGADTVGSAVNDKGNGSFSGVSNKYNDNDSIGKLIRGGASNMVVIDEDLHSCQLAVYGRETMRRLFASKALTSSFRGCRIVALRSAVVFTEISLEKAIDFYDYCHRHQPSIAFIKAEVRGLFGSVFCDFGPEFTFFGVDGEEPHTGIIASISNDNPSLVSCVDHERLVFQDGDLVIFSEVHGMKELNDGKPRRIKNARAYSFTLEEDTTNYGAYEKGGIVTQVKQPKVLNFKPLKQALVDPGNFLLSDFSKFDRPSLLHLAFQALDTFISELGRFPVTGSEDDAQKVISIASNINENLGDGRLEDMNPKLLRQFTFGARAVLNPMAAMLGGIVGQEVVKACSRKFHPLFQYFYFDSVESLPTEPLDANDLRPINSRYDAQISVFGQKLQKILEDAQGKLTITDDDVIEKSNLSRQFLFRDWNIGQAKSKVAASAAASINPRLIIEALQNRVGPETENVFHDTFWENLSVVVNALDNVNPRLNVDQRCLYFQKPLLDSGTLGAKCNTQMVIPHLTENYGASRDPPEKQAPMSEVNAYLSNPSEYTNAMIKAGDAQARDNLERVLECLDKEKCETFQDCITWARLKFEDYFAHRVKQLTYTFPEDAATSTGAPFWSAPKRFPRPLQFSSSDEGHLQFVMAASILRAETYGISIPDWVKSLNKLAEAVDGVKVPNFQPRKDAKIVTDEKATSLSTASVDDAAVINDLIIKLGRCGATLPPGFRMKPIQFEKDDDTNYHMDVIAGLANMRTRNYSIPEVDKLKAKFIARRIIPAIATSTAMATGFVCLELYKVLARGHKLQDYHNTFGNLALPLFSIAEPVPPKVIKHQNMSWTVWDRWIVTDNPTLSELLEWLKSKGWNAYSISCGSCLLYNSMFPRHRDRMDKKVVDLAREVAKMEFPPYRRYFDVVVACEDDEDNGIDIPQVSIYFH
ncbi:unnamed protein product [Lupinus luteus]|uniref:Protein kinase domain-containing protein n=1 Tax=Lupinus luteus TaxID=3873 RepID=A0AAV1WEF5_LUPLU